MGDKKEDFTLLQNLGEFTHAEDADVDRLLGIVKKGKKSKAPPSPPAAKKKGPPTPAEEEAPEEGEGSEEEGASFALGADEEEGEAAAGDEPPSFESESTDFGSAATEEGDSGEGNDFGAATDFGASDDHESGESAFGSDEGDFKLSDDAMVSSDDDHAVNDVHDDHQEEASEDPFSALASVSTESDADQQEETKSGGHGDDEEDHASDQSSPSLLEGDDSFSSSSTLSTSPLPSTQAKAVFTKPETLSEVKEFAESMSYGKVGAGGNPPFGIILKNIKYKEDARDILIILREHGLLNEKNEEMIKNGLENGSLLISQISEFSAIYLTHKFRRFDLEILMGLADEIHPSKSHQNPRGLVDKSGLLQNRKEALNLEDDSLNVESILLSTTPQLEGKKVLKYLGIVSIHRILEEDELLHHGDKGNDGHQDNDKLDHDHDDDEADDLEFSGTPKSKDKAKDKDNAKKSKEWSRDHDHRRRANEMDLQQYAPSMSTLYQNMANDLRPKALALKGNAVVGINFVVTPLLPTKENSFKSLYQLTCTGNVVWVS